MRQNRGDDPVRRPADQVPDQRTTDAETSHHEFIDSQMVHQGELVVGEGVPGFLDLQWARRAATIGVAGVERDAAMGIGKLDKRIERSGVAQHLYFAVQSATRNNEHRKAGARLFIANTNRTVFENRHDVPPLWPDILAGIGNVGLNTRRQNGSI